MFLLSNLIQGQSKLNFDPTTNVRYGQDHLPSQVDVMWTPPEGWEPSPVDKWIDWDLGLWDGNSLGSCVDCPAEAGSKWDYSIIGMYDSVYLTKIRFVITEPEIHYAIKVYQGAPGNFDTLLVYPLEDSLTFNLFDTLDLEPILLDTEKDLWLVYWVNSLASGYPLPLGVNPAMIGYGNLLNWTGYWWDTLTSINPGIDYNWSIGGFLETPNDTIKYPLFNIYRAIDDGAFEMINQSPFLDTIYYDYLGRDLDPLHLYYYVTCLYEAGESEPSDTLHISFVGTPEMIRLKSLKVYPNPAKDQIRVESTEGKIMSVSVITIEGEVVLYRSFNDENILLDISCLPSSLYILQTITENGTSASKLMISKQ